MRYIIILFFLSSCSFTLQSFNSLAEECCDPLFTDLEEGRVSSYKKDKYLFVMVFDEGDQASFDQPFLETLAFTEKKDKIYLRILRDDFVTVKIFRAELDQYLAKPENKEEDGYCQSFSESFAGGSFAFISTPEVFCVYSPAKFTDKEALEELLWVKFGP
ncbi:MAG: hypothetical protein AAGD28_30560 [Bacteroidota bacterium]